MGGGGGGTILPYRESYRESSRTPPIPFHLGISFFFFSILGRHLAAGNPRATLWTLRTEPTLGRLCGWTALRRGSGRVMGAVALPRLAHGARRSRRQVRVSPASPQHRDMRWEGAGG